MYDIRLPDTSIESEDEGLFDYRNHLNCINIEDRFCRGVDEERSDCNNIRIAIRGRGGQKAGLRGATN